MSQNIGIPPAGTVRQYRRRLVITAVITEGRSQGEVARAYGVSQVWVSRLVARYRAEGEAAFRHHRFRAT